jgi:hypothetical protein
MFQLLNNQGNFCCSAASSRQHYLRVIKSVAKTTENIQRWEERICEREKEIQELEKLKREFQGTSKVSEQKKARAKSCSQQSGKRLLV